MQALRGYQLVNSSNTVLQTYYQVTIPDSITIPGTNDHVCAPVLEHVYSGVRLVQMFADVPDPSIIPQTMTISKRQFYQQAAVDDFITTTEALAAMQIGTIPPLLMNVVNTITVNSEKFKAEMLLTGASDFQRDHPLTLTIGSALSLSNTQIDTFFNEAGLL
jgi:hypothetical protein